MLRNSAVVEQLINLLLLAVIVAAAILAFTENYYWLGISIFFAGLLMLIVFRYKASDYLEELLTLYPLILAAVVVGSLTQGWLMDDQRTSPIPALAGLVEALPNSYPATLFISLFVGLAVALLLAGILFLLLGLSFVSVVIEDGEIKGKEKDKQILETFGGPGRVRIYPGQVVVFHKHGKVTRAAGLGTTLLRRGEKIKAIIPLGLQVNVQKIENVLTRDRIALTLSVAHGAGIEFASNTRKRLKETQDKVDRDEKDERTVEQLQRIVDSKKIVGDEHDQCYAGIAKLVAAKGPDPWAATKGGVGVNLRDVFMTHEFEDLFEIEGEAEDLKAKIDQRKIAEIEKFVLEKVKGSKIGDGIVLIFVDINEVHFPESLHEKLKKVSEARLDERAAQFEARAIVIRARAEAQAKILAGQSEGEARAAFLRQLLQELRRENVLPEDALAHEVLGLISRMVSAKDWESFAKAASMTIPGQLGGRSGETNGSPR